MKESVINHNLTAKISMEIMNVLIKHKLTPSEMKFVLENLLEPIIYDEKQKTSRIFELSKKIVQKLQKLAEEKEDE